MIVILRCLQGFFVCFVLESDYVVLAGWTRAHCVEQSELELTEICRPLPPEC